MQIGRRNINLDERGYIKKSGWRILFMVVTFLPIGAIAIILAPFSGPSHAFENFYNWLWDEYPVDSCKKCHKQFPADEGLTQCPWCSEAFDKGQRDLQWYYKNFPGGLR